MKKVRYVRVTYTRDFRIETDSDKEATGRVLDGEGTPVTGYMTKRADVLTDTDPFVGSRIDATPLTEEERREKLLKLRLSIKSDRPWK